jgi:hypothetical protein
MLGARRGYIRAIALSIGFLPLAGKDILLEFKGAYFHPTETIFKQILEHGAALVGPEVTFSVYKNTHWYGFASVDFLSKKGRSIGLCDETTIHLIPLALGLKYFIPWCRYDFYLGVGFQPIYIRTRNCSPFVSKISAAWGYGGIAKLGVYIDLACHIVADIFVDYSFVTSTCPAVCQPENGFLLSRKANMNGIIVGVGLGYRFN